LALLLTFLFGAGPYVSNITPWVFDVATTRSDLIDRAYVLAFLFVLVSFGYLLFSLLNSRDEPEIADGKLSLLVIGGSAVVLVLGISQLWLFNIDDKWIYYRTSKYVLETGLPIINRGELYNINTSFLYPYLMAPGHFLGDWQEWEAFSKVTGALAHVVTALAIWWFLGRTMWAALVGTTCMLYLPLALWSIGGLETPFATLWTTLLTVAYLRFGASKLIFWFLAGLIMWLRPDAILLGVGIFLGMLLRGNWTVRSGISRGLTFSLPILGFLVFSQMIFQRPLPGPYYVKGLNKSFSATYGLFGDFLDGLLQFASAITVSTFLGAIVLLGIVTIIRGVSIRPARWRLFWARHGTYFDVLMGCVVFVAYHAAAGYQHMGFGFRYFLPAVFPLVYVTALSLQNDEDSRTQRESSRGFFLVLKRRSSVVAVLFLLLAQNIFLILQTRYYDVSLTRNEYRDHFSVGSYARYMNEWMQAGVDLRNIVKETDRVFIWQGLATIALTDAYFSDQFYIPMLYSAHKDIKLCAKNNAGTLIPCYRLYNILLDFGDKSVLKLPPEFIALKEYESIRILKLDATPIDAPTNLIIQAASPKDVSVSWRGTDYEGRIEIQLLRKNREWNGQQTVVAPPQASGRYWIVENVSLKDLGAVRLRACTAAACSRWVEWTAPL
jgi:hypothetical protein